MANPSAPWTDTGVGTVFVSRGVKRFLNTHTHTHTHGRARTHARTHTPPTKLWGVGGEEPQTEAWIHWAVKLTETPTLRAFWSDRYWQGQEEKLPRGPIRALRAAGAEKQPPGTAAQGLLCSPGAGPPRHPSWWQTFLRWSSKCHELGAQGRPVIVATCLPVWFAGGVGGRSGRD